MIDQSLGAFFLVPMILFLVIVAPIWLVLHYRSKGKAAVGLGSDEHAALDALTERAAKMSERIATLEAILDAQASGWRERQP